MSPEFEHALTWLVQTLLVGVIVITLGAVFGVDYLFIDFGEESRSLIRLFLFSLLAMGSVFFLLLNVSQLINEKTSAPPSESKATAGSDDSTK